MKKIGITLVLLTSLCSTQLFSQKEDSYTIWIGKTKIFCHHETDVGDTVIIKRSWLTGSDTLFAEYHHLGSHASGASTRLTLRNDLNHLLRGELNTHSRKDYRGWMPLHMICTHWKLQNISFLFVSLVIHNPGESSAHGFKIGVIQLVD
jgi:hypothetical protein